MNDCSFVDGQYIYVVGKENILDNILMIMNLVLLYKGYAFSEEEGYSVMPRYVSPI
jgi:hypothetical protein